MALRHGVHLRPLQASDLKAQYSQLETERLLADLVRLELSRRRASAQLEAEWCAPDTKFSPICIHLGYQVRSSLPSNFDCDLGFAIGEAAAALVAFGASGYVATAHCLTPDPSAWRLCGTPLYSLLSAEEGAGQPIASIRPSRVDLRGAEFCRFAACRETWKLADVYLNPGPLQFEGALSTMRANQRAASEAGERAVHLDEIAVCMRG